MNQKHNILNIIQNENIEKIYNDNFKDIKIKEDIENNKNIVLKNNNNILSKKLNLKKNFGKNITNKIVNEMLYNKNDNLQKNEYKINKENKLIILSKRKILFINNNIKDKLLLGEEKNT